MTKVEIDIVIPLYNEASVIEANVKKLIDFLTKSQFPYSYVITLVNNASTDDSLVVCCDLADKYKTIQILNLPEKGKGRAIKRAWRQSEAKILVFMDADLSSDLRFLLPLVRAVKIDGFDLAIGNRLGRESQVISRRFVRKVASYFYNFFIRLLFWTGQQDHQCGFKAIKQKTFLEIQSELIDNAWFFDTELIVIVLRHGFRIKPIDIVWVDNIDSKVSIGRTSCAMFLAAWRLRKRLKRSTN